MANRFVLNETSYHGAGAIAEIATETRSRGFKKAFVCSDPDLVKFGVTQKVLDVLDKMVWRMSYIPILSQIQPLRMYRLVCRHSRMQNGLFDCDRRWFFDGYSKSNWNYY